MPATLPTGIGNNQQALQATAFIREQPWYQQWMTAKGKTADANGNPQPPLNDSEQLDLNKLVRENGIGMNNKFDGIDQNGQIVEEHHKLKKALIAAAIGGLAITGLGAAGIGPLAGAFAGGSAAAAGGAGAAEGSLVGSAGGIGGALGTGGAALEAGGAATGVLGGAAASSAIPAALAAGGATAAELAPLATTAIPGGAVGLGITPATAGMEGLIPATVGTDVAAGAAAPVVGGTTLSRASSLLNKGKGVSSLLEGAGAGLGGAANASASNRSTAADLLLRANQVANQTAQTNTQGQSAFETELMNRAKEEQLQRTDALKNVYRQSYATNRTPGPFNQAGVTKYSPEYLAALGNLTSQGGKKLAIGPQYDTNGMPVLQPYKPVTPVDPNQVLDRFGNPTTLENTANWLSPTLSTLGKAYQIYRGANA